MRIRKLDLNGFKSFPDRTVVEFGPGISAVVGPNGSGKSNILDAIRWVIGEQSARALRGSEMLDVIFAGSADRAAVSYAEVVLTLAADDGEPFPGEYARFSELQVGRRLHRTGASEYFVNQTRCRRRDVTDLFLDTGVATDLYCFIEQGSIGKIVHATPAERRVLIEEAAGISRYKVRRDEAQARLVETATQLDRAADVAEEMGHRLRHLEGQVARVVRYRRLRARVRQQEILLALARYADLTAERRRLRDAHREMARKAEEEDRQARRLQGEADARRDEASVVEAAAHTWRDEVAEQDARIREFEGALAFAARRADEIGRGAQAADAEAAALDERLRSAGEDRAGAEADVEALTRIVASLTEEGSRRAAALESARAEADAIRARAGEAERRAVVWASRQDDLGARRASLLEARASASGERERALSEAEERAGEVVGAEAALVDAGRAVEALARDLAALAADVGRTEAEARAARDDLARADEALASLHGERLALLQEEARLGTEGEDPSVEALGGALGRSLAEARGRAEAWLVALDAAAAVEVARIGASASAELGGLAARHETERSTRTLEASLAVRKASEGAESDLRALGEALASAVRAASAARDAARERLESCDGRLARLTHDRQVAEGRLAGLVERDRPDASTLAELTARPTLLERRHDAGFGLDDVAALGDRAALPVADDEAEILAIATRVGGDRVRLAWEARPLAPGEILPGTRLVGGLDEALSWHRETGGAAAVRGSGERVGSDGVVTLGDGAQARAAAIRRDEAARLRAALAANAQETEALGVERVTLARILAEATHGADASEGALRRGEHAARAEADERVRGIRAEHELRSSQAREAEEAEREAVLRRREAAVVAAREVAAALRADTLHQAAVAVERLGAEGEGAIRAALDARSARLDALRAERDLRRRDLDVRIADAQAARDETARRSEVADQDARAVATRRVAVEVDLAGRRGEVEGARARSAVLRAATEAVRSTLTRLDEDAARRDSEIALIEAELSATPGADRPDLEALRAAREIAEQAESAARDAHAAVRVEAATAGERLDGRRAAVDDALRRLDDLRAQALAQAERRRDLDAAAEQNAALVTQATADAEVARAARASAWDRLVRDRDRAAQLKEALRVLDEAVRAHAAARDVAAREAGDLDVRAREAQVEVEALRKRLEERYLVVLPALLDRLERHGSVVVETDEDARADVEIGGRHHAGVPDLEIRGAHLQDYDAIAALVEQVDEGKRQVAALGEVNLAAVDEYDDVRRRHTDLVAQRTDLELATGRLRDAIAKMNRTSRERFRETFDRVAENLERLYPRLTGGGQARLALTDEEDLLETGVEIFVQPPGKRLQNLALLSGGEKAMTAIAVLLSLFQVKPSPFCVLDEVDAPLDEVNGGRFNEMLREMSGLAQFILITHNRKTMEAADTLYGITMPTPGVSRLVSVRLSA